ncbi:MAG TPA: diaminopimelate decarboxylase [Candidatus Paceibacterota bacterium]
MKRDDSHFVRAADMFGTPVYVYEESVIRAQCQKLKRHFPEIEFHYAVKANANPQVLRIIREEGIGAEAVSLGELSAAKRAGFPARTLSFTCSSLSEAELVKAAGSGARINLDSLTQLEIWGRNGLGKNVSLRINQGIGAGHHAHVMTGGPNSKFGITLKDIPKAKEIAVSYGLRITGIQQHIGSNVLDADTFLKAVRALLGTAGKFPDVAHVDFGGGLGIPYRPEEWELDLKTLGKNMRALLRDFKDQKGREIVFAMEPGRFIVAESGTLVTSVTDVKETAKRTFVGVNTGFNHLIRHAMYGAYHPIDIVGRRSGKKAHITVAGNICESGDLLAIDRSMLLPEIGELLAIRNAGAYGFSMASHFNLRALPKEALLGREGDLSDISFPPWDIAR